MDERQRSETALALLDALADANERTPILVEGQRDLAALRALGCGGEIHLLHRGAALADVAHDLTQRGHRAVILLPDWDRQGLALRERAQAQLHAHGLRVDTSYHERLVRDTELTLKDVETLSTYASRGLEKFHRMSLEDHVRGRQGDPLGVAGVHEEFEHRPLDEERASAKRARSVRPKRRARPRDE